MHRPARFFFQALAVLLLAIHAAQALDATCSRSPTAADLANGLAIVADPTCAANGTGCVSPTCRYCRVSDSVANQNLLVCSSVLSALSPAPSVDTPCAATVPPGDVAAGVSAVTDVSCGLGGLGCFSTSCRFCRLFDSPQSASFMACAAFLPPTTPAFDLQCDSVASAGDTRVGIALVTDVSCILGGVGCTSDVCRFCRRWATSQSIAFMRCGDIDPNDGSDIEFTPLPPNGSGNGAPIGSKDRPTLDVISFDSATVTRTAAPDDCATRVSDGDAAVGISAKRDLTCRRTGGLGCFDFICRYCKRYDTPQSSYLSPCVPTESELNTSSGSA